MRSFPKSKIFLQSFPPFKRLTVKKQRSHFLSGGGGCNISIRICFWLNVKKTERTDERITKLLADIIEKFLSVLLKNFASTPIPVWFFIFFKIHVTSIPCKRENGCKLVLKALIWDIIDKFVDIFEFYQSSRRTDFDIYQNLQFGYLHKLSRKIISHDRLQLCYARLLFAQFPRWCYTSYCIRVVL